MQGIPTYSSRGRWNSRWLPSPRDSKYRTQWQSPDVAPPHPSYPQAFFGSSVEMRPLKKSGPSGAGKQGGVLKHGKRFSMDMHSARKFSGCGSPGHMGARFRGCSYGPKLELPQLSDPNPQWADGVSTAARPQPPTVFTAPPVPSGSSADDQ